MAITSNCAKFLFYSRSLGTDFRNTLTLGRLNLYVTPQRIQQLIDSFKNSSKSLQEIDLSSGYSEPLFQILGAQTAESIDYSDYEDPSLVHDMNTPVPDGLKNKYTAVVDGGTMEHIFNFPVAIRNCMEMLQTGGHYVGITPANNLMGHGFYQFSPELFYRIFSPDNGFEMVKLILCAQVSENRFSDWYEVVDPKEIKERVMFTNSLPVYLLIVAKKISQTIIFNKTPQQSDYETIWAIKNAIRTNQPLESESRIKFLYRKYVPAPVKKLLHLVKRGLTVKKVTKTELGEINPRHFKKIDLKN